MCVQDHKIAKHIVSRVIRPLRIESGNAILPNNPDRFGLSTLGSTATLFVNYVSIAVNPPVPQAVLNDGTSLLAVYTDLRIFPGMNSCQIAIQNPASGINTDVVEQYYDRVLSRAIEGDL